MLRSDPSAVDDAREWFQWAPTLGGECYLELVEVAEEQVAFRFNGHPPLGVNATFFNHDTIRATVRVWFQWAPTLGGECYEENYADANRA